MARVILVEGPVGAGKSTYARTWVARHGGVHIALDEWFVRLFSPDRPASGEAVVVDWYLGRKERLLELIWLHSRALLATGVGVVLELGLIRRADRAAFCERLWADGVPFAIHVLDAPLEVRRARVVGRNAERGPTFAMHVSEAVFERASALWEPLDEVERDDYEVVFPHLPSGASLNE